MTKSESITSTIYDPNDERMTSTISLDDEARIEDDDTRNETLDDDYGDKCCFIIGFVASIVFTCLIVFLAYKRENAKNHFNDNLIRRYPDFAIYSIVNDTKRITFTVPSNLKLIELQNIYTNNQICIDATLSEGYCNNTSFEMRLDDISSGNIHFSGNIKLMRDAILGNFFNWSAYKQFTRSEWYENIDDQSLVRDGWKDYNLSASNFGYISGFVVLGIFSLIGSIVSINGIILSVIFIIDYFVDIFKKK